MNNDAVQSAARSKTDWLEQIERYLAGGDYNQAKNLTQSALSKFPDDPEILALEEKAIHGRENGAMAFQLMQEGQQLCEEQNFREGLPVMRDAYAMDVRSAEVRLVLVKALLSHASAALESDPVAAESSAREAMELDPDNAAAKNLHRTIQGRRPAAAAPPSVPAPEKSTAAGKAVPLEAKAAVPSTAPQPAVSPPAPRPTVPPVATAVPPKVVVPPLAATGGAPAMPAAAGPKPSVPPTAGAAPSKPIPPVAPAPPNTAPGLIPGRPVAPTAKPPVPPSASVATPRVVTPPVAVPGNVPPTKPEAAAPKPAVPQPTPVSPPKTQQPAMAEPAVGTVKPAPVSPKASPITPPATLAPPRAPQPAAAVPPAVPTAAAVRAVPSVPAAPAPRVGPVEEIAPQLPASKQPQVAAATSRKVSVPVWILVAGAVGILAVSALLTRTGKHSAPPPVAAIQVVIRTSPSGAKVRINGEPRDIGGPLSLAPGNYRIEALLDGYQTAVQDVSVNEQTRGPIELNLLAATPGLRVSTDLETGIVLLDNQRVGELQDGQYVLDDLKPGKHTLQITSGRSVAASIPFEASPADPPVLTGTISATNLRVIVFSNSQARGHVYCNFGPVPLSLDGQPTGDVPQAGGLDLSGLNAASHQFVLGKGKDQRKITVDVTSVGGLFVSLSSDRSIGNLEIVANVEGFDVLVNGKPHKITKQKGHYYLYNLEAVPTSIQIAKNGFQSDPPEQKVAVRKGDTVSVTFKLTLIPTTATLHILGVLPGTRVTLDGTAYDLQADGSLTATLKEGEHIIDLKRPGYKPKSVKLPVKAGQTINLSGHEMMVEELVTGKLVVASRNPANAKVVLRRRDGTETAITDQAEEPEGDYTLIATAPGFKDQTLPVHIVEGTPASVDVRLVHILVKMHMEGWENSGAWKLQEGWYSRKGGNFALFNASSNAGTYQFTARPGGRQFPIFRGGHVQWVVNYVDDKNYELYQMDKDKIMWKRFVNGKPGPEKREAHRINIKDETYRLLLETGSGQVVLKVFDGQTWQSLPQLSEGGANASGGKFGFYLPGNDEIRISDFEFTPKE